MRRPPPEVRLSMHELLTLSRAARLVGVSRGELQKRIRDNELNTFEGQRV